VIWERLWHYYLASPALALLVLGNVVFVVGALGLVTVALWLRNRNDRRARFWAGLERRLEAKTVEVINGDAEPAALWRLVRPGEERRFLDFLLRFARRLVGSERDRVDHLAEPYLPSIVPQLRSRIPERRARAIQTITTLSHQRYRREVFQALDDPSPLVAMVAARSLVRRGNPEFAGPILRRLHRFGHWRPSFLASMLASIGPTVTPALRAALADRSLEPATRGVAADALREVNDYSAADVAARVLDEASDRELLMAALGLLAHVGGPDQVEAVRRHLQTDDPVVRSKVMSALGRIGEREDMATLIGALDDASPWVALRAAEALHEAKDPGLARIASSDHPRAPLARQILAGGGG